MDEFRKIKIKSLHRRVAAQNRIFFAVQVWRTISYDSFHRDWKYCTPKIHQISNKFLGTNSNSIKISIWICTASNRGIWVSRFDGLCGCYNFRENRHTSIQTHQYLHMDVHEKNRIKHSWKTRVMAHDPIFIRCASVLSCVIPHK